MHFFSPSILVAILVTSALATITPKTVETFSGKTSGRYIITLKKGVSQDRLFNQTRISRENVSHAWGIINGFAGNFIPETLNLFLSDPTVESVTEDGIMHTFATQTDAPWGLSRLSSTSKLIGNTSSLNFNYTYSDPAGSGVDVYVVDTGVRTTHVTFGGRASWGAIMGGYARADGNGHGTHCAGIIAGEQYGVAKKANIIAIKALNDEGSGPVSDIISGLDVVKSRAASSGRPSVVSMSIGGSASTPLDNVVASLTNAGIHVVVAAGQSNSDAGSTSPARVPSANTVGASTIDDARASSSNYGTVVDIFAPGQDVISAWSTSDKATNQVSGTSTATAHVAGLIALYISRDGNSSPADITAKLQSEALKDVLIGIPSDTVNYLAHIA